MSEPRSKSSPPVSTPPPAMRVADVAREIPGATIAFAKQPLGELGVRGVHHDSRAVEPGDVFVAREGGRVSGLGFVAEAVRRGAVAVLARRGAIVEAPGVPVIEVDDVPLGLALASAAVYGHPTFGLEVVGITGTNGKTTTTLLCRSMIEAAGGHPGTIGTLGYELPGAFSRPATHTSPEADDLARLAREMRDRGATHLVMEVSSIALAARRADGVRFRVAAFTNLTQDHLDYHGTMDAYADAKARLFTELGPGSAAINVGSEAGRALASRVARGARLARYAASSDAAACEVYPVEVSQGPRGISLRAATPVGEVHVESPLLGAHNVENLLCAIAIGTLLDLPPSAIESGLSCDVRVSGRLERCDDPKVDDVVVLVDYAHTPGALARVLSSVRGVSSGAVVCVMGCGGDRDPLKRPLMGHAAGAGADRVIVTNDNPRSESPRAIADQILPGLAPTGTPFVVELDRAAAIRAAILEARPGDLVLVAGKGHETYQIIGATTFAFDDREVAKAALAERRVRDGGGA
jgi:UDP-N-acetylmuramoyl-L-alanyl-D-glutamate--2,6-diaminopimelate ligase